MFESAHYHPKLSLEPIGAHDSLGWKNLFARKISQRVTSDVHPGSIVLLHNTAKHTPMVMVITRTLQAAMSHWYPFAYAAFLLIVSTSLCKGRLPPPHRRWVHVFLP